MYGTGLTSLQSLSGPPAAAADLPEHFLALPRLRKKLPVGKFPEMD